MAIDILKTISKEELDMITKYRRAYAAYGDGDDRYDCQYENVEENFASTERVLRFWAENKEKLYHLFGDKLIISKEFYYEKSEEELTRQMRRALSYGENVDGIRNTQTITKASQFYHEIYTAIHKLYYESGMTSYIFYGLIDWDNIIDNRYAGPNATIELKEDDRVEVYKIQTGTKITKAYAKIAQFYGIENFEEFRLVHSQVLNQKKLKGTLCLSIHPLDFMTMSDNSLDWQSCMSWRDYGCYRQGTVEMMNSPVVAVAYIKGDSDYTDGSCDLKWNNKKWRQLIVIDDKIISGIKSYPYYNKDISIKAIDFAVSLFGEDGDFNTGAVEVDRGCNRNNVEVAFSDGEEVIFEGGISFETEKMYNDIYDGGEHMGYAYISRKTAHNTRMTTIVYSGETECMWCGEEDSDIYHASLVCGSCYRENRHTIYCSYCDSSIDTDYDDYYTVDGHTLCEDCYFDETVETVNDNGTRHFYDRTFAVAVRDGDTMYYLGLEDGTEDIARFYHGANGARFRNNMREFFTKFHGYVYNSDINYIGRVDATRNFYNCVVVVDKTEPKLGDFIEYFGLRVTNKEYIHSWLDSFTLITFKIEDDGETITQL